MSELLVRFRTLFRSDSVKGKFFQSAGLLSIASGIEKAGRFGRNMLIARILSPEHFGLMAMVLAATWATKAFTQVGVQQCIIQHNKGEKSRFLHTAWSFSAVFSISIFIIAFFCSPYIADFYGEPKLSVLLRVSLVVIILDGIISPRTYTLEKQLNFKKWVVIQQGAGLCNIAIAIILSLILENIWALVFALVGESVFRFAGSYILCPFIPKFAFYKEYRSDIFRFTKGIIGLPVLMLIFQQMDIFFLGKLVPKEDVGKYHLALVLGRLPYMIYMTGFSKLILPLFSKFKHDEQKFTASLLRISKTIVFFGMPLICFFVLFGESILSLAYGPEYRVAAGAFAFLAIYFFSRIFSEILAGGFISLGKPGQYRNYSIIRLAVALLLLYPLIAVYGISGAAATMMVSTLAFWLMMLNGLSKHVSIDIFAYLSHFALAVLLSFLTIGYGLSQQYIGIESSVLRMSSGLAVLCINWLLVGYILFRKKSYAGTRGKA